MTTATSRVTAQNQISIPAAVRRRFGIGPGTELVWAEKEGEIVVRLRRTKLEAVQRLLSDRPVHHRSAREQRSLRDAALARKYVRGGR